MRTSIKLSLDDLLDMVQNEINTLREVPDNLDGLNALEITLQDIARSAHNEAWERVKINP